VTTNILPEQANEEEALAYHLRRARNGRGFSDADLVEVPGLKKPVRLRPGEGALWPNQFLDATHPANVADLASGKVTEEQIKSRPTFFGYYCDPDTREVSRAAIWFKRPEVQFKDGVTRKVSMLSGNTSLFPERDAAIATRNHRQESQHLHELETIAKTSPELLDDSIPGLGDDKDSAEDSFGLAATHYRDTSERGGDDPDDKIRPHKRRARRGEPQAQEREPDGDREAER
jgi:hypothetical protein